MRLSGFSAIQRAMVSQATSATSGLVAQSCCSRLRRWPSTSEKYSGWSTKYFSTGTSPLKEWPQECGRAFGPQRRSAPSCTFSFQRSAHSGTWAVG